MIDSDTTLLLLGIVTGAGGADLAVFGLFDLPQHRGDYSDNLAGVLGFAFVLILLVGLVAVYIWAFYLA